MRIFKTAWFERFARKNTIDNSMLSEVIHRLQKGLIDADLGNGVFKKRIPRLGQGLSKGYRAILLVKHNEAMFFMGLPRVIRTIFKKMKQKLLKD